MKDRKKLKLMAPSVAFFVIAVILPAAVLGFYGAVNYADATPQEFWKGVLINDQSAPIAALTIVGLVAAAMSTTDSQLFALGNESTILLKEDKKVRVKTKAMIFLFAVAALLFSVFSSDNLVPLARLSFAGTGVLAPMILLAIFSSKERKLPLWMPIATLIGLVIFILSALIFKITYFLGMRIELILYAILTGSAIYIHFSGRKVNA